MPTIVHLLRHGEVLNPDGVLYGRLPGFPLTERGHAMAGRAARYLAARGITDRLSHLRCSPLVRTRQTIAPTAALRTDLTIVYDERVIEAGNVFEGQVFGPRNQALWRPSNWKYLRNPLRPSWGEAYADIVARMNAAIRDAAEEAERAGGGEALIVSHQLPIWMARSDAEGRCLVHDPRRRQCSLASLTSLTVVDGVVIQVDYAEPARDLLG